METLKKLICLYVLYPFKKLQPVSGTSLLSFLSGGGEWLFTNKWFPCPCTRTLNLSYSIFFLTVSPLLIILLGYAFNRQVQWLMIGYYTPSQAEDEGSETVRNRYVRILLRCYYFWPTIVAAIFWISVALMEGDYYECAISGSSWASGRLCPGQEANCTQQLPLVPCQKEKPPQFQEFFKYLKASTQMVGCSLIALVFVVVGISQIIITCISPVNYQHFVCCNLYYLKEKEIWMDGREKHDKESIPISTNSDQMPLLLISSSGLQYDSTLQESDNEENGISKT